MAVAEAGGGEEPLWGALGSDKPVIARPTLSHRQIIQLGFLLADPTPPSNLGRILCVVGDQDAAMGEGTVESNGVIDDAYLPPWDTWFACVQAGDHRLLLAWIPASLVNAVQAAIQVAATEPIAWLTGPHPLHSAWQDVGDLLADALRVLDG